MTQEQTKPRKKRVTKKDKDYLDKYRAEAEKIYALSVFATKQLLGERPADDPRVQYMAGLEAFKNLANAQLSALTQLIQEFMGDKEGHFREIQQKELARQVESMEQDFAVTGWNEQGQPLWENLEARRERTATWPTQ